MTIHPRLLEIADFSYDLPPDRIAKFPLPQRDGAQLLLHKNGENSTHAFTSLARLLPPNSFLVFNNSRVIEARLLFIKPSGGHVEVFVLEPVHTDVFTGMEATQSIDCLCIVGGLAKWKQGPLTLSTTDANGQSFELQAHLLQRDTQAQVVRLSWQPAQFTFAEVLHAVGQLPIPPYLQRAATSTDAERYQTVYAQNKGSVAAPTAGLHFTPAVMQSLANAAHQHQFVTLHVGAGTFKPVKSAQIGQHDMHAEYMDVSAHFIEQLMKHGQAIPVGTTSMRTVESLYWMGVKALLNPQIDHDQICISQWDVYDDAALAQANSTLGHALKALLHWMAGRQQTRLICKTQILIAPGYRFRVCKGLITNFHQPQSTLLLLVAALIGPHWQQVYNFALQNNFRFLSYGDSSLLLPPNGTKG